MNKTKKIIQQKEFTAEFPYTNGNLRPELTLQNYVNCKIFCELFEQLRLNPTYGTDFYERKNTNFNSCFNFKDLIKYREYDEKKYQYFKESYLKKLNEYWKGFKNENRTNL